MSGLPVGYIGDVIPSKLYFQLVFQFVIWWGGLSVVYTKGVVYQLVVELVRFRNVF